MLIVFRPSFRWSKKDGFFNRNNELEIILPPTRASSEMVSNEGVFYKFIMQIKINRLWSNIEVLN
jgi:hypothetical protein